MQVVARRTLREFWERHPQAEPPMRVWFALASKARWSGPNDIKAEFGTTVDFLHDHKGLIQDGKSQALRIDEDVRVLIDIAHTKVRKEGIDDKGYLVGFPLARKREDG